MAVSNLPLAYCTNAHPGRDVAEVLSGLEWHTVPLARRLARPVGVGLWMTAAATKELGGDPRRLDNLAHWLGERSMVPYTMNAFPVGHFHAERVKRDVYLPDWASDARFDYTRDVVDILAKLLPEGMEGSVSTSPCAFKGMRPSEAGMSIYFPRLVAMANRLATIRKRTGKTIRLAIEPEPGCVLETTAEAIVFFRELRSTVTGPEAAAVAEHLALCYDVCHQAVEFEDVAESIDRLEAEEIRIAKVHVTCALELSDPADEAARRELARFVEPRYLHQTVGKERGGGRRWQEDLTEDLAIHPPREWLDCQAWRVHFHVPVHREAIGRLRTTRRELALALARVAKLPYAPHLEVETYTWSVLPTDAGPIEPDQLVDGLEAEMRATEAMLAEIRGE